MLWMALYFPALPLEVFTQATTQSKPFAISQTQQNRELVTRCNQPAYELGIRPGLAINAARALSPQVEIHSRDVGRENNAMQQLALWAHQFSSRILFEPLVLLMEIGASLRLFGGLKQLHQTILSSAQELQFQIQHAIAPTPMAAALLARSNPGQTALTRTALQQLIRAIPLHQLTRDKKVRELITNIGLSTIGDCLALPRPELARRTHPQLLRLFDQLQGYTPDPRPLWQAPDTFSEKLELLSEVHHQHALIFPARRLITALCGYLRGRGAGTQLLRWRLQHREEGATQFEQGLAEPCRDTAHILDMFRERIERVQLPQPVIEIQLQVDQWCSFEEQTLSLLQQQKSQNEVTLLERLRNRLGEKQVQGICCVADHRPEQAWRICSPGHTEGLYDGNRNHPFWLLNPPLALGLNQGKPTYGGPLTLNAQSERIESGWWDDQDIARDYFTALNPRGERLWIFLDRRSGNWYLQGLYD